MRSLWGCVLLAALAPVCHGHPPLLVLYPQQLQFPAPFTVSATPTKQLFVIENDTHGDMEWTSQIVTSSGGSWLSMSPGSGTLPDTDGPGYLNTYVSVSPVGLKPGVYTGSITISGSRLYEGQVYQATDSPQTVTVTYTVYEASVPSVKVSSNQVALQGVASIGTAVSSTVTVSNAGPGTLNWTASAQTSSASNWLSVNPASGTNTGTLSISANPAMLTPGTYTGTVNVAAPGSPTAAVSVTFAVRGPTPPQLKLSTQPLTFTGSSGSASLNPQYIAISNPGETALNWRAACATYNGGSWLTVAPGNGTNNGSVVVIANVAALLPGFYAGVVTVSADGVANTPAQIPVSLTVSHPTPSLDNGGIYNAASLSPDGVVAGSIASIFGARLGPAAGVSFNPDPANPAPSLSLAGTTVMVDGVAAPLFFVSASQINLQIPIESAGKPNATVRIQADGVDPAQFTLGLAPAALGIFSVDGTRAAAINQDGTLNTDTPAPVGSVVQFYATGQGVANMPVKTGAPAPLQAPFPAPVTPFSLQIGGLPAKILFAGLAPGTVGMLQINAQVPAGVNPSDLTPVAIQSGSAKPSLVYISTSAAAASSP